MLFVINQIIYFCSIEVIFPGSLEKSERVIAVCENWEAILSLTTENRMQKLDFESSVLERIALSSRVEANGPF